MIVGDGPAHRGSLRSPARRENLVEFEVAGDLAAALGSARATACGPRAPARGVGDRSVVTTCSSSPRTTGRLVATDWTRQRSADVSRTVIFDRRSGRVHLVDQKSPSSSWRVAKLRHRPAGWRLRASLPNGQPVRPRRTGTGGRRVGVRHRDHHRGPARARRPAGHRHRTATGAPGQHTDRDRSLPARPEVRPRVQGCPSPRKSTRWVRC
jgi:hypothetical protein